MDGKGEKHEKHGGGRHRGRHHHHHGAQTFRRGRALEFLARLNVKRSTLKQQLDAPEFQEIRPVILGELKAIEQIINEYTEHFEIREAEGEDQQAEEGEGSQ
ncbi:hypothetical protein [Paenibacillus sp. BC26]|uniref:hypothetical protein n=1 Tax=Paenibacillus sp. BC26 TaxID=1881032 RepID=UPI000B85B733|nr:hypothetical protein [Paenibacillus sp. BC26]